MTSNGATAITQTPRHRRIGAGLAAAALLGALLAGCSASNNSSGSTGSNGEAPQQGAPAQGGGAGGGAAAPGGAAASAGSSGASGAVRQVVKDGELYLTVDDPVAAATKVAQLADRLGGRVDERQQQAGTGEDAGSADLTIRVPAGSLEDAVTELGGLGDVTRYTEKTEDVTGTVVDLDARIAAAQASVDRVEGFLGHTSTTTELLSTEQALSQRQSDLEQLRGQRAALADQVSMSTLHVSLTAPGHPAIETPGPRTFAGGLAVGWHGLLAALRGLSVALGVLLPWLVLGAIVAAGIVVPMRLRRRRTPPPMFGPYPGSGPMPPAPPQA
jgi:hypothetical protein